MNTTKLELLERKLKEFNAYFTSGNNIDVAEKITVSRNEWRELLKSIEAYLEKPDVSLDMRVLAITTAYEQGFGKGEQRVVCDCPYTAGDWLGCDVAWNYGYEEGKTKTAKSALLATIDWTRKVALDPAVSPEAAKLLEQCKALLKGLDVPNPDWWVGQLPEALFALAKAVSDQAKQVTDVAKQESETLKPLSVVYRWTALKDGKLIYQYSDLGYPEVFKRSVVTLPVEPEQPKPAQEPVAYGYWDTMIGKSKLMMVRLDKNQDGCTVPLYASPQ